MRRKLLIALALVGLSVPTGAGAVAPTRVRPPAQLNGVEQGCQGYGTFVYNRGLERDAGFGYFDVLARARQWDASNHVLPAMRAWHDKLTSMVFSAYALTPAQMRQLTEVGCIEGAMEQAASPADLTPQFHQ